jgi:malonyl CoA-acyl carrier protein transacylase/phosphopantetheinyl transferase
MPAELLSIGAEDPRELATRVAVLTEQLAREPRPRLRDVAYSLSCERPSTPVRAAVVASSWSEAERKLRHVQERLSDPDCARIHDRSGVHFSARPMARQGGLAVLFPGEGSQHHGMLASLCMRFPQVRRWFDLIDRVFTDQGRDLIPSHLAFGSDADIAGRLWELDLGTVLVFAANQALYSLLTALGLVPDAVLGHSTGEYSSLLAAGAVVAEESELPRLLDRLRTVYESELARGTVIEASLLAVGGVPSPVIERIVSEQSVHVAMDNCPNQVVLCCDGTQLADLSDALRGAGALIRPLPFARAYHTPHFAPFCEALSEFYASLSVGAPRVPLWSATTTDLFPSDAEAIRGLAASQFARPVRFRETVERMHESGIRIFVESGPRGNLTAFVRDTLRGRDHLAVAATMPECPAVIQFLQLIAQLAAEGVALDLAPLFAGRGVRRLELGERRAPSRAAVLPLGLPTLQANGPVGRTSEESARDQALRRYVQTMRRFVVAQAEIAEAFLGHVDAGQSTDVKMPPLAGETVHSIPGAELEWRCRLSPGTHPFLKDHCIGRHVSDADRALLALPVMPFTMTLELMAEAAVAVTGGGCVSRVEDMSVRRWLTFEHGGLVLRVTAHADGDGVVSVSVHTEAPDVELAEARVLVSAAYPEAPSGQAPPLEHAPASRWTGERIYTEGMFTGPAFQGVASVERQSEHGADATLRVRVPDRLLRDCASPVFAADPVLLDAAGQVVGLWAAERFDEGFTIFPVSVRRIDFYRSPVAPGEIVACQVRVGSVSDDELLSDIDLRTGDGSAYARIADWRDRRLPVPRSFARFVLDPSTVELSRPVQAPVNASRPDEGWVGRQLSVRDATLPDLASEFWLLVLAFLVLGGHERDAWLSLRATHTHRVERLLGWVAAKEAVAGHLRAVGLTPPRGADIEIAHDERGKPMVVAHGAVVGSELPAISISHSSGTAIAVCGGRASHHGVGVDIERIDRSTPELASVAFDPDERRDVPQLCGADAVQWATRLWSAKEATGKALGVGLPDGALRLRVRELDAESGTARLRFAGQNGHVFEAHTSVSDGYAIASAIVEEG